VLIGLWSFSRPPAAVKRERAFSGEEKRDFFEGGRKERETSLKGEEKRGISLKGDEPKGEAGRDTPAPAGVVVEIGDGAIVPSLIHLEPSTPIAFQSSDGQLHSLELIAADGSVRANVPILASGAPRSLSFEEVSRSSSVRCAIHPKETASIAR
jgi:hypothetical protein